MTEAPAVVVSGDVEAKRQLIEKQPDINDAPKWLRKRQRMETVVKPDGQVWREPVIDISDMRARNVILEMLEPSLEREAAHARTLQARIPKVTAITPRGERRQVAAYLEGAIGAKGFRPAVYYGKATHIERWSDGLLYRETPTGFEPMGVCCIGTPLTPCGNPKCARCR